MSRRVPELALVTGVFLGLSLFGWGVFFTGNVPLTTLSAVAVCYPFAGYAVYHSPDPTAVLPPRVVGAVGGVAGLLVGLTVLVGADSAGLLGTALFGGFVALVVALPPLAYLVRYDPESLPVPPAVALVVGTVAGLAVLLAGVLAAEALLASVTAALTFLSGALYASHRGLDPVTRLGRGLVLAGAALGIALVAVGLVVGPAATWVVEGVAVTLTTTLYYVVSVEWQS